MTNESEFISQIFETKSSPELERFIDLNLDISEQIMEILSRKGWTQKDLANKLGKSEAEISKWLSGIHNLTLKSIAKMEATLGEFIIVTPKSVVRSFYDYEESDYNNFFLDHPMYTDIEIQYKTNLEASTSPNYQMIAA